MARDTSLASRLREDGLKVKEVEGWKTRGSETFHPKAFVRHHTAGGASGDTPSLNICINGRSDLAGPLCNIYLGRDGIVYVIAAGRANHAGTPDGGSWKGCLGNSDAYGFEIEHTGTSMLAANLHEIAARACAALIRGRFGASMVCDHKEWAPSRKIDLATGPSPSDFRSAVDGYLKGDFLMALTEQEQKNLSTNAATAAQFARGVQAYWETFKANGNKLQPPLKMPTSVDKEFEVAGWKLADRLQNIREAQKAAGG